MSGYLTDSIGSAGNRKTFTISAWVKVNGTTTNQTIFGNGTNPQNSGKFYFAVNNNVRIGGGGNVYLVTNRVFRDPASWYHMVCAVDTTQGTAADRIKFYVNGVQETSFSTSSYPGQNDNTPVNESGKINTFGAEQGGGESWDGYMTHMVMVDGAQLTPSNFGETDSTTGEWKPKPDPTGVTYGTNGAFLKCENSGNFGLDSSGQGNNYTSNSFPAGAHTVDCASNNFCTMNPLANKYPNSTFTLGNLAVAMGASQSTFNTGTFGVSSGKWYFEMKPTAMGSGTDNCLVGIVSRSDSTGTSDYLGEPNSVVYRNNGQYKKDSGNATYGASWTTSNIVMVAVDCDNNNIYFGTDNQWADGSGNNDEAAPNSAISFTSQMISDGVVFPTFGDLSTNSPEPAGQFNFGNPPFTISSGNADANGYGNFEYAPPTGYYALCTKNINQYG